MNTIGPILAKYRRNKQLTQPELAQLLKNENIDVTEKALSNWEKGRSEPNIKQLFSLCKVLEIRDIYEEIFGLNPYNSFSRLNDLGKERVNEYIDLLLANERFAKAPAEMTDLPPKRILRKYTLGVSAGTGEFLDDDNYEEIVADEFVPANADFAVHISGDSMMPMFYDKQTVYVHRQESLEDGEIGIFFLDGNAYCKKLMKNKKGTALISLNKKYKPIPITENSSFKVFGKVV